MSGVPGADPADDVSDDIANSRVVFDVGEPARPGARIGICLRRMPAQPARGRGSAGRGGAAIAARATCVGCPASAGVPRYALEYVELVGIWGGSNSDERARIRAERRSARDLVRPSAL